MLQKQKHLLIGYPIFTEHRSHQSSKSKERESALSVSITRAASKQTYYTIRYLVDRDRVLDAFRAYAYFRWVDDQIDRELSSDRTERLAFVQRQQTLLNGCYGGEQLALEERMLMDLTRQDQKEDSGLRAYLHNMMAVMAFDADRRGRLISQQELNQYSHHLAAGVTEALHYFIGHDDPSPQGEARYFAVTGAHITHMLRDTFEDVASGYFNIPCEFLQAHRVDPCDTDSDAYRTWVENRVQLARDCFKAGKTYLAQVKNRRCRLAGYAYTARFEGLLDTIEREGYQLRPEYPECKSLRAGVKMGWSVLSMIFKSWI